MFVSPSGIIPLPPQCKILKHQRPGVRTSQRLVFVMYKKAASFLYYHDLDVYRTQKTCENVKEKKSRTVCLQNKFYSPCRHTTLVLLPKNRCPSITFTCSSLRAKHLRAERYSTSRQNRTRNWGIYNKGYELNQRIFALGRLFSLLAADARAHA